VLTHDEKNRGKLMAIDVLNAGGQAFSAKHLGGGSSPSRSKGDVGASRDGPLCRRMQT
jgi:hypothetical protein